MDFQIYKFYYSYFDNILIYLKFLTILFVHFQLNHLVLILHFHLVFFDLDKMLKMLVILHEL